MTFDFILVMILTAFRSTLLGFGELLAPVDEGVVILLKQQDGMFRQGGKVTELWTTWVEVKGQIKYQRTLPAW